MATFDHITLRTKRLLLRPTQTCDAADLFAIFSDPRVARYLSKPPWTDIGHAHARIARDIDAMQKGSYLCLGIVRTDTGQLIGECSLFNWVEQCRRAELGYSMALDAWGHGFMHEALTALLDHGFADMQLNRVEADIDPRNTASATSLTRLGFVKEGHLRQRWIVGDEVSDSELFGLLASDWQLRAMPQKVALPSPHR